MAVPDIPNGLNGTTTSTTSKPIAAEGSLPTTTTLYQGPKDDNSK